MTPRVSVIIPMFNSEATVARTLGSLREQSRPDWEAIVVDDGSTDRGAEVVRALNDSRIRVLHQANAGPSAARNRGIDGAVGEFVCFLDSDDWLLPGALEALVAAAQASPGLGACGGVEVHDGAGELVHEGVAPSHSHIAWDRLLEANRLAPGSHIEPRAALRAVRFDERIRLGEDYDLWLRLAERGLRWKTIPDAVAAYRVRPGSLSRNFRGMFISVREILGRAHARAALRPGAAHAVPAGLGATVAAHSFEYATMTALGDDDPAQHAAAGVVARTRLDVSPAAAAAAAYWGLAFGWGVPPRRARVHWARAAAWWDRCVIEGWARPGLRSAAFDALASLLVPRAEIAEAIVGSLAARPNSHAAVTLVGYGANGRALASCLRRAGVPFVVRDDRFAEQPPPADIHIAPMDAPLPEGPVVVTPDSDSLLAARLAGPRTLRWTVVRSDLARAVRSTLDHPLAAAS